MSTIETQLIESIHSHELSSVSKVILANPTSLNERELLLAKSAQAVSARILERCQLEGAAIVNCLVSAGIPCEFHAQDLILHPPQFEKFTVTLECEDPTQAVNIASDNGYWLHIPTSEPEWTDFRRNNSQIVMTRIDDVTTRMVLKWSVHRSFFSRVIRRLARELQRLVPNSRKGYTEPFLGTPASLLPGLLEFASVSSSDVLLDVGCGDGRVLIEAARVYGCRCIGYELEESLCDLARASAVENGVEHLVEINNDEIQSAPHDNVSVVFLFLPVKLMSKFINAFREQLKPGARIVAHEQLPIESDVPADCMAPLFSETSITVAHLWMVP